MRDPVERAMSQYWHNVRDLEYVGETRAMFEAITQDPEYINFSDYTYQLTPYIEIFCKDRIYVQTSDEMRDNHLSFLVSIFKWLGVDSDYMPENLNKKWNVMPDEVKQVSGKGILNTFRYAKIWSKLSPMITQNIKELGKKCLPMMLPGTTGQDGVRKLPKGKYSPQDYITGAIVR